MALRETLAPYIMTAMQRVQGLALDVDAGTLAVYVNGRRLGLMVGPGQSHTWSHQAHRTWRGAPVAVAPLCPPLRWAVQVYPGLEVGVEGPQPTLLTSQPAGALGQTGCCDGHLLPEVQADAASGEPVLGSSFWDAPSPPPGEVPAAAMAARRGGYYTCGELRRQLADTILA